MQILVALICIKHLLACRYGIWGDWENPYLTLDPKYEAAQLRVFSQMLLKGHIYRGRKPVHWSPSSQTALAESELEYPEGHVSPSIYVAFPIEQLGDSMPLELQEACSGAALAIWTTTPWTMPANAAVAVNEKLQYSLVEVQVSCIACGSSLMQDSTAAACQCCCCCQQEAPAQHSGGASELHCLWQHPHARQYSRCWPMLLLL